MNLLLAGLPVFIPAASCVAPPFLRLLLTKYLVGKDVVGLLVADDDEDVANVAAAAAGGMVRWL